MIHAAERHGLRGMYMYRWDDSFEAWCRPQSVDICCGNRDSQMVTRKDGAFSWDDRKWVTWGKNDSAKALLMV